MLAGQELEGALAGVQAALEAATRTSTGAARELKRAAGAAASGQLRELRRALDAAAAQAAALTEEIDAARAGYDLDEVDLLTSGGYAKELLAAAAQAGVTMIEEDDRLLCYPSILRVLPADAVLEVDRRRVRALRPSVVVAALQRAQQAQPRFRPEPFLSSLLGAYDLVVARQGKAAGSVVKLADVYVVLTLLPGQPAKYVKPEFARDLHLLDQSQLRVDAKTGRTLRWSGSTGTRHAGVLTTVARSGQLQRYWGIAFDEAAS